MKPLETGGMDRRQVIGKALAMAGLPGLCCTTEELPASSFTVKGGSILIDLKRSPALSKPGSAVRVVDLDRNINLIVVHPEKNRFAALDRSCTHGGAQVAYNRRNRTVHCSSWGQSEFALNGDVLGGSAKKPLRNYAARRSGGTLEILLETGS